MRAEMSGLLITMLLFYMNEFCITLKEMIRVYNFEYSY
jgi:hypothetical protein